MYIRMLEVGRIDHRGSLTHRPCTNQRGRAGNWVVVGVRVDGGGVV